MTLTNQDLEEIENIVSEKVTEGLTNFRDELYTKIDPILSEVVINREERTLIVDDISKNKRKIKNHEKRISSLEASI